MTRSAAWARLLALPRGERERLILVTMADFNGFVRPAARFLGIDKGTLDRAIRDMGFIP